MSENILNLWKVSYVTAITQLDTSFETVQGILNPETV